MLIANPIYDVVFKRLLENKRIAKFLLETVLDTEISDLVTQPQEKIYKNKAGSLALFRYDFIALIKQADGSPQKVLIEIQKAGEYADIVRFREYLGSQYVTVDDIDGKKVTLPIITLYFIGFNLRNIKSIAFKVKRDYIDLLSNEIIHEKSQFVELLTHDCYIVQIGRIDNFKIKSRLTELLSIFEQKNFINKDKMIKEFVPTPNSQNPVIKEMLETLEHVAASPKDKEQMELEAEAHRVWRLATDDLASQLNEAIVATEEAKATIKEAKAREEEERKQKQEILEKQKTAIIALINNGIEKAMICSTFQISIEEQEAILKK